jgi:hypothetical protein
MASGEFTGISSLKEIRRKKNKDLAQWFPVVPAVYTYLL